MTVRIDKVKAGPQVDPNGGGYETSNGFIHVTEWMCDIDVDGKVMEAKVRVGSKSEGTSPPLAKYIEAGCVIVPNKQGIKEFHGKHEVYLNSTATKDANGDGGGFGDSSGASHTTSTAPQNSHGGAGVGTSKGDRGQAVGSAINNAVRIAIEERGDGGEVSFGRIKGVAGELFALGETLMNQPSIAPPAEPDLWVTVEACIKASGLTESFNAGDVTPEEATAMYETAGCNPTEFGMALKAKLDEDSSNMPF